MKKLLFLVAFALWPFSGYAQTPGAQPEICVTSPSQTANYNQLCISASSSGGNLTFTNFGSATGNFTMPSSVYGGTLNLQTNLQVDTGVVSSGGVAVITMTGSAVAIAVGTGNPTLSAPKGSLYLENGAGQLWINQSGSTTWTQITVP